VVLGTMYQLVARMAASAMVQRETACGRAVLVLVVALTTQAGPRCATAPAPPPGGSMAVALTPAESNLTLCVGPCEKECQQGAHPQPADMCACYGNCDFWSSCTTTQAIGLQAFVAGGCPRTSLWARRFHDAATERERDYPVEPTAGRRLAHTQSPAPMRRHYYCHHRDSDCGYAVRSSL
jgi:hypothetical protein